MRYLLDSDYIPDKKSVDLIRLLDQLGYELEEIPPAKVTPSRGSPIPQDDHPPSVPQHPRPAHTPPRTLQAYVTRLNPIAPTYTPFENRSRTRTG